jgi:DNA-binding transcriptional ArsR family regulator
MDGEPDIAQVAALVGEPARAAMLAAIADGRALPAGELARVARVSPATASAHLARLRDGGLVSVERHGRHRYHRVAGPGVVRALESLALLAPPRPVRSLRESNAAAAVRHARSCYDHLAGAVGVAIADGLLAHGLLERDELAYRVTGAGAAVLADVGIDVEQLARGRARRRPLARACLDWSERRHHVAGPLGAELLARGLALGWLGRRAGSRAIDVTPLGREQLPRRLPVTLPPADPSPGGEASHA